MPNTEPNTDVFRVVCDEQQRNRRTWLWITTALADLYGADQVHGEHGLYTQLRGWLRGRGHRSYHRWTWDDQTGIVVAQSGEHRQLSELSDAQWTELLDYQAFDAWLVANQFAGQEYQLALAQLARLGLTAEPASAHAQTTSDRLWIALPADALLKLLEPGLRARLGTPGWDELDQHTADALLGVDSGTSTPARDAAIRAAADPWQAALQYDLSTNPAATSHA